MSESAVDMVQDGVMSVREASEFSGISRSGLYELMAAGRLPWCQPTSKRLIPRKSLIALLAANLKDCGE